MHEKIVFFGVMLGGALLWGGGNVLSRYYLRDRNVHEDLMVVGTMLGAGIFSFLAELAWHGAPQIAPDFWLSFLGSAMLNVGIVYLSARALKLEDASIVVPLSAATPMFLILMSWWMLGEWPSIYGRLGIGLIACGSYILAWRGAKTELPEFLARIIPQRTQESVSFYGAPWLRLFSSRGARLALMGAYLGSISVNFDKVAILKSSSMIFTGFVYLTVAFFVFGWSKTSGRWNALDKKYFRKVLLLGAFIGLYTVVLNTGYFFAIVPYVAALKRTQVLWTIVFAALFLREQYAAMRIAGACIMLLGATLIAW